MTQLKNKLTDLPKRWVQLRCQYPCQMNPVKLRNVSLTLSYKTKSLSWGVWTGSYFICDLGHDLDNEIRFGLKLCNGPS